MKVTRQGEEECMLATISALSRVPLNKVRHLAFEISKCGSWAEVLINHPLYWKTIKQLTKEVGLLERKIPTCSRQFSKGNRRLILPMGIEGSVCSESLDNKVAHIDPFSEGKVWGTYNEMPIPIDIYRVHLRYKKSKITGIWY